VRDWGLPRRACHLSRSVTRWDVRVFVRAAFVATLALALSWLLTAATDEGGVAWGERIGRTLPLAPLCSAVGVWAAIAPMKARGEARALEALGRSKSQVSASAMAGGACVAVVAAVSVGLLPAISVVGFYPTARHSTGWTWDGTSFVDTVGRLRVTEDGTPIRLVAAPSVPEPSPIPRDRMAAALATAMTGIATALLLANALLNADEKRPGSSRPRARRTARSTLAAALAATGISGAAALVLFQAAAVRKVPALLGALPPLALLLMAIRQARAVS